MADARGKVSYGRADELVHHPLGVAPLRAVLLCSEHKNCFFLNASVYCQCFESLGAWIYKCSQCVAASDEDIAKLEIFSYEHSLLMLTYIYTQLE